MELEASSGLAARVISIPLEQPRTKPQQELRTPRHTFHPGLRHTNKSGRRRHPRIYLAGQGKAHTESLGKSCICERFPAFLYGRAVRVDFKGKGTLPGARRDIVPSAKDIQQFQPGRGHL